MIHHLRSMIGFENASVQIAQDMGDGGARAIWVRAVPCPFYGGFFDRLNDAWAVLTGRVYAVHWPKPGELEDALAPAKPLYSVRTARPSVPRSYGASVNGGE